MHQFYLLYYTSLFFHRRKWQRAIRSFRSICSICPGNPAR